MADLNDSFVLFPHCVVVQSESSDVMDSFNTEAIKLANMGVTVTGQCRSII